MCLLSNLLFKLNVSIYHSLYLSIYLIQSNISTPPCCRISKDTPINQTLIKHIYSPSSFLYYVFPPPPFYFSCLSHVFLLFPCSLLFHQTTACSLSLLLRSLEALCFIHVCFISLSIEAMLFTIIFMLSC